MASKNHRLSLILLCTLAGTAAPLFAQPQPTDTRDANRDNSKDPADRRDYRQDGRPTQPSMRTYRNWKWMSGRDVVDAEGKKIADIKDIIVERGTGRIVYVALKTEHRANADEKTITVPFEALTLADKDKYTLSIPVSQLASEPVFKADAWKERTTMKNGAFQDPLTEQAINAAVDPYAGKLDGAQPVHVDGTVKKVDRRFSAQYGQQVVVTVAGDNGSEQMVTLGPSWYVGSGEYYPMRGDKVSFTAYPIANDPDHLHVASGATLRTNSVQYRDENRKPLWSANRGATDGGWMLSPFVLASELNGATVDCRGESCGKVYDLIIDTHSGDISFLSIDPNKNFLGIADTKRLVPWNVVSVPLNGKVYIDADKDMVLASMETPKDFTKVSPSEQLDGVYRAYQVDRPMDMPRSGQHAGSTGMTHEAWGANGPLLRGINRSSVTTVTGTCDGITTTSLGNDVQDARVLRVKTADGVREVIVGPSWYTPKNEMPTATNKTVTIEAYPATIGGKQYWVARSVKVQGGSQWNVMDENGNPEWERP